MIRAATVRESVPAALEAKEILRNQWPDTAERFRHWLSKGNRWLKARVTRWLPPNRAGWSLRLVWAHSIVRCR